MSPTRREVLQQSIEARQQEIMFYDINIANYQHSISGVAAKKAAKIDRLAKSALRDEAADTEVDDLVAYEPKLVELLASERRERAKAQLFLEAAQRQLDELPPDEA